MKAYALYQYCLLRMSGRRIDARIPRVPPEVRIESRRRELLDSTEMIDYVGYGLGAGANIRRRPISSVVRASKSRYWGRLLYTLCRGLDSVLELGSCVGISAAYMASAIKGRLITLEGDPESARFARDTLRGLPAECRTGPFAETLVPAALDLQPIDLAFIDGHHDRDATIHYFETLRPYMSPGGVIVLDDISWSRGMTEAWNILKGRGSAWCDLRSVGIVYLAE